MKNAPLICKKSTLILVLTTVFGVACAKKQEPGPGYGALVTPRLVVQGSGIAAGKIDLRESFFARDVASFRSVLAATAGQSTSSSLKSLKYFIQTIQICKNLVRQGSGFSSASGCIPIYTNPASNDANMYAEYDISTAMADTSEDHWIDFMSATSRGKLSQNTVLLSSDAAGEYRYGLINFMKTIKIDAEFKDSSGMTTLYTKTPQPSEVITDTPDAFGRRQHLEFTSTDPAVGPSSEMTVMNNNGGTIVEFLSPFEITADDISEQNRFEVDFVFNPDGYADAYRGSGTGCSTGIARNVCGDYFIPMGKLAPVPHKDGNPVKKEVYLISNFTANSNLRVELYYDSTDTDRAIMGIDRSMVLKAGSQQADSSFLPYFYRATESSGAVTFYDYNSASGNVDRVSMSGFIRRQAGTASFPCMSAGYPSTCTSGSGTANLSYSYVGEFTVSAE